MSSLKALLDEKFLFSEKRTVDEVIGYAHDNCKDIIAIGFDPDKTFIFSDYEYMGGAFYKNVTRFSKLVTYNVAKAVFGFNERYAPGSPIWARHVIPFPYLAW